MNSKRNEHHFTIQDKLQKLNLSPMPLTDKRQIHFLYEQQLGSQHLEKILTDIYQSCDSKISEAAIQQTNVYNKIIENQKLSNDIADLQDANLQIADLKDKLRRDRQQILNVEKLQDQLKQLRGKVDKLIDLKPQKRKQSQQQQQ